MTAVAGFRQQTGALVRKSILQQRRSVATNACLLVGPVFFCVLLFILQLLTNRLLLSAPAYKCGCRCLACCKNGKCTALDAGYCDEWRGFTCEKTDESMCGVKYSSATQAVWCPIPQPSTWPPVVRVPRPRFFAPPDGPNITATSLVTSDPDSVGWRAAVAGGAAITPATTLPNVQPGSDDARSAAVEAAEAMYALPRISPANIQDVLGVLRSLVNEDMTVFNGHLLARLGLQFANARRVPWQYYLDDAFVNSGTDLDLDTLFVLMPNGTCRERGLAFDTVPPTLGNDSSPLLPVAPHNVYNLTTFLLKFYSYDYGPSLPALLAASGFNTSALDGFPLFTSVRVGCIDVASRGVASEAVADATVYCGWRNGRITPLADCYKAKSDSGRLGFVESYSTGWNFIDLAPDSLAVDISYNRSLPPSRTDNHRLPALVNQAVQGWARTQLDPAVAAGNELLGIMSMPKPADNLRLDFSSLLGPLFYAWVVQLLLPTMVQQLVYEKERRLRVMMKQHGLGDGAYWAATYAWFLLLHVVFLAVFVVAGSLLGLQYFRRNAYGIQIVFYFLYAQLQMAFAFLLSCLFQSSRTAVVTGYLYVLATGIIGYQLLGPLMDDDKRWLWAVELLPAFSLYRGLHELGAYAFLGVYRNEAGMQWHNLRDDGNGMVAAWAIMAAQVPAFLLLAWYLEQVVPTGAGSPRHPLFFLQWTRGWPRRRAARVSSAGGSKPTSADSCASLDDPAMKLDVDVGDIKAMNNHHTVSLDAPGPTDVQMEKHRVEQLLGSPAQPPIICSGLHKQFPAVMGRKPMVAVQELCLAVSEGECFGLLGPNGAGKTSAINMLTGLLHATAGTAVVQGYDIRTDMQSIYKLMGVCPQHDLLWEQLTGREHLRFYGRLKGMNGPALEESIDAALKAVNLYNAGWGNKAVGKYSGGMKRRLSVAISFIGNPQVVYLDEPSTGLDPASRRNLWDVVKGSKAGRSIILTTHSMEEAEQLCDRLGIFVDGRLVCIGNPKEITSRYAGFFVFTISVPPQREEDARALVLSMSPNAVLTYALGGTLKYELPTSEVTLSKVFQTVNAAKAQLGIIDWGVANATLEEVFIKLAKRLNRDRLD